jgi:hypothetical protein
MHPTVPPRTCAPWSSSIGIDGRHASEPVVFFVGMPRWCEERRAQAFGNPPVADAALRSRQTRSWALPWINRAFGRKPACPSTWITYITASALVREGLATISVSGNGSWLRLTASGRHYAKTLAEVAEAKAPVMGYEVSAQIL